MKNRDGPAAVTEKTIELIRLMVAPLFAIGIWSKSPDAEKAVQLGSEVRRPANDVDAEFACEGRALGTNFVKLYTIGSICLRKSDEIGLPSRLLSYWS